MRASILYGVVIAGLIGLLSSARAAEHTKDTTEAIQKAVADGKAVLLDVREKSEWDDGHLKDAKLLPLSVLKAGAKAEDVPRSFPRTRSSIAIALRGVVSSRPPMTWRNWATTCGR